MANSVLPYQETDTDTFTVTFPENLDYEVHNIFRNTMREIMAKQPHEIVFDFAQVDYIDSAGLGMLMMARQETETNDCKLILKNLADGHPRKVLEMVKFDQLFHIEFA